MTAILTIRVPGKPCSVNRMYASNGHGGKYLSTTAVEWKLLTMLKTREAKHLRGVKLTTPLTITCRFYGTRKNADVDNLLKCTLDGLASGLGINDKHFGTVTAIKATGTYTDGAVIEVWASEAPQENKPDEDDHLCVYASHPDGCHGAKGTHRCPSCKRWYCDDCWGMALPLDAKSFDVPSMLICVNCYYKHYGNR